MDKLLIGLSFQRCQQHILVILVDVYMITVCARYSWPGQSYSLITTFDRNRRRCRQRTGKYCRWLLTDICFRSCICHDLILICLTGTQRGILIFTGWCNTDLFEVSTGSGTINDISCRRRNICPAKHNACRCIVGNRKVLNLLRLRKYLWWYNKIASTCGLIVDCVKCKIILFTGSKTCNLNTRSGCHRIEIVFFLNRIILINIVTCCIRHSRPLIRNGILGDLYGCHCRHHDIRINCHCCSGYNDCRGILRSCSRLCLLRLPDCRRRCDLQHK